MQCTLRLDQPLFAGDLHQLLGQFNDFGGAGGMTPVGACIFMNPDLQAESGNSLTAFTFQLPKKGQKPEQL